MSYLMIKVVIIVLLLHIITTNLYSVDANKLLLETKPQESENIYVRMSFHSGSSFWQKNLASYQLSLGFNGNEIGINYRRYIGKMASVRTYWLYKSEVIFWIPVNTTIESEDIKVFNYGQINLTYSKLFRITDWLSFNINTGIGYGSGYERKAINETTNILSKTSGVTGVSYIKEYKCDIKDESLNSFAFPIGISVDLDIYSWLSISLGYDFNNTVNFNDENLSIGVSIFLLRE